MHINFTQNENKSVNVFLKDNLVSTISKETFEDFSYLFAK